MSRSSPIRSAHSIKSRDVLGVRLRESGVAAEHVASIRLGMNEREAMYPGMPSRGPFTSTSHTLMSARFAFATGSGSR